MGFQGYLRGVEGGLRIVSEDFGWFQGNLEDHREILGGA